MRSRPLYFCMALAQATLLLSACPQPNDVSNVFLVQDDPSILPGVSDSRGVQDDLLKVFVEGDEKNNSWGSEAYALGWNWMSSQDINMEALARADLIVFHHVHIEAIKQKLSQSSAVKILVLDDLSEPNRKAIDSFIEWGDALILGGHEGVDRLSLGRRFFIVETALLSFERVADLARRIHGLSADDNRDKDFSSGIKGIDAVLLLNLDRSPDRLSYVDAQLQKVGIRYRRLAAVDGKRLDLDALKKKGVIDVDYDKTGRDLTPGEIGNYLSHRAAWYKARNHSATLILEDDVRIHPNVLNIENILSIAPADWDIIYLGCLADRHYGCSPAGRERVANGQLTVVDHRCAAATHAYLINQRSARLFETTALPIRQATDGHIGQYLISGAAGPFKAYCVNPELITQNEDIRSIIDEYGRHK